VVDRRGARRVAVGGGIGAVVLTVLGLLFGVDLGGIVETGPADPGALPTSTQPRPDDELADFVTVVLADTEDTWNAIFADAGREYREPTLVMFTDAVPSACGFAGSAVGPFYCPADERLYIDLSFYRQLQDRLGAPGDFAQAYVIAHEVGHHVQHLLGISGRVHELRQRVGGNEGNQLSVRLELQADCFAGLWAHHAARVAGLLEPGDIEEALDAASAIGDDTLQRNAGRAVVPDSFTHGSSEQRQRWFRRGYDSGKFEDCDSFKEADL
jgi:predicted metalloprotease